MSIIFFIVYLFILPRRIEENIASEKKKIKYRGERDK